MAALVKTLAVTLGCGGIAVPVYFLSKGDGWGPVLNSQTQYPVRTTQQETLNRSPRSSESIEQASCSVSDLSSASPEMVNFVKEKKNSVDFYSFVSCNNPALNGREGSYLGKDWQGLFPTSVLSTKLSYKEGAKFTIVATTDREDDDMGNPIPITTFSNPDTKESIKGRWGIEDTTFNKKAIVIQIIGMSQSPNKIYLFVDPIT